MIFTLIDSVKAVVLGAVEGITEFLPISSTGHLILLNQFVYFREEFTALFDIVIQLGAILAVTVYFRDRIWPFGRNKGKNQKIWNIWLKTALGVIPVILVGAVFGETIKEKLFYPWIVALALLVGGVIILIIENKKKTNEIISLEDLTFKTAFFVGLIQCLSMIPGTSRSAATIMGAIVLGASRTAATEFSFYLAIPTMLAASAYSLLKYKSALSLHEFSILVIGFVVAFIMAFSVVKFFVNYAKRRDFKNFGYYRIALGILIILYFLIK